MKATTFGILLHRIAYSESSVITTFYTKDAGIQKFIFQGAKKKSNVLFPLSVCELIYYKRPDSELGKLTEATPLFPLNGLMSSPIKASIAFFLVDVLKQTLQTNQSEERVFDFLTSQIQLLNEAEKVQFFPIQFLAKYTDFIGISPQLMLEPLFFNLMEGEFHSDVRHGEVELSGEICRQLLKTFEGELPDKAYQKEVFEQLIHYYKIHSPRFNVDESLQIIEAILH